MLTVSLGSGQQYVKEKTEYEGFHTHPMTWESVVGKFRKLSEPYIDASLSEKIVNAVSRLEEVTVSELLQLLAAVRTPV